MEGFWYYDSGDTTSVDNLGTILVNSTLGYRYKRVYDNGVVNVRWFGAVGDGINDDTSALQSAINFVSDTSPSIIETRGSGGGTAFFPEGTYLITSTLLVGHECRLLGTHKSSDINYLGYPNERGNLGTTIKCVFENINKWAISSASYLYPSGGAPVLLPYNKEGNWADVIPEGEPFQAFIYGITIEGLLIDGGEINERIYGGIRLDNAPYSNIINCTCYNFKIGFLVMHSFINKVDNIKSMSEYYGLVIRLCNDVNVISSDFNGILSAGPIIDEEIVQEFTTILTSWILNINSVILYGNAGVFVNSGTAINLTGVGVEGSLTNGTVFAYANGSVQSYYSESINKYAMVFCGTNTRLSVCGFYGFVADCYFYFGDHVSISISDFLNYRTSDTTTFRNLLFCPDSDYSNSPNKRTISFKNVLYTNIIYSPSVLLLNDSNPGANYGCVYVNPDVTESPTNLFPGNDNNYGFTPEKPVQTFDAALIRVQNQSTLNPVKTIFIKGAPIVGEGGYFIGAVNKNIDIVPIQNCDILITSYDTSEENPRGRIYFENNNDNIINIGQIEFEGNVKLYFRNVDLVTNNAQTGGPGVTNDTIFGLKNSKSIVIFESNLENPLGTNCNIYLGDYYNLFKANFINPSSPLKSLIDTSFLNIKIINTYGALSPIQFGGGNLGVICTALNSTRGTNGWQDAQIIMNNF